MYGSKLSLSLWLSSIILPIILFMVRWKRSAATGNSLIHCGSKLVNLQELADCSHKLKLLSPISYDRKGYTKATNYMLNDNPGNRSSFLSPLREWVDTGNNEHRTSAASRMRSSYINVKHFQGCPCQHRLQWFRSRQLTSEIAITVRTLFIKASDVASPAEPERSPLHLI